MKKWVSKKQYRDIYYIPRDEKIPHKVFQCRIAISFLSILVCIVAMVSSTLALLYTDVATNDSTLAGAHYSLSIDGVENDTYICPPEEADKHVFKIKADGTAATGYCKIQIDEQVYYTDQISRGEALTLTIQAAEGTKIVFTPQWGTSSYYVNKRTCGHEIVHSTTPRVVDEVETTDDNPVMEVPSGTDPVVDGTDSGSDAEVPSGMDPVVDGADSSSDAEVPSDMDPVVETTDNTSSEGPTIEGEQTE